jgi:hypothetical protein
MLLLLTNWVTVDGLTNTILVIDMRCLDIRAEP